ncbi:retrovirus-related pol polyprotein from transposon TNT 1-94 [Tanacetum coccineum]
MSGSLPPIPPPFGTSSGNPSNPNANRVNTMPTNTKPINTMTTTNVSQCVVDENIPQLLDSRRESHVTNVPAFDKEDFTSWKVRLLCKTAKEIWNDLILSHEGPSDTRDTKIVALRLKFNAFKSLEGEKVNGTFTSDSDVEEDQRTNNEFMADLNAEYHERALLANQKRFYKRPRRVGLARKPIDKTKETCFACGKTGHFQKDCPSNKTSTPSYPSSNKSFNKLKTYTSPFNQNSSQNTSNHQKDYKGKYKGLKAETTVLTKRIDDLTKGNSEKGKNEKGKSEKGADS